MVFFIVIVFVIVAFVVAPIPTFKNTVFNLDIQNIGGIGGGWDNT